MAINPLTTSVTQVSKPKVDNEGLINVAYTDPSLAEQYSEFLTKEDIDPQFEKEDPLFKSLQDNPLTIGRNDVLGYGAGTNLWTLSEDQKKAREKQLGQLEGVPDLLFGWEGTGFGGVETAGLNITDIGRQTDNEALFNIDDDPTGVVRSRREAIERAAEDKADDPESISWLEKQWAKLSDPRAKPATDLAMEGAEWTYKKAKDLWSPVPEVPTVQYPFQVKTGLATTGRLPSSGPPPASLAGQGDITQLAGPTGLAASNIGLSVPGGTGTGLGTQTTIGSAGTGPVSRLGDGSNTSWLDQTSKFGKDAMKLGGKFLAMYSAMKSFSSGTPEGKFSGSIQTAALMNPALAPYVAAYEALKFVTGWSGITKTLERWGIGGGSDWDPSGGVEFRAYDTETDKAVYPGDPSTTYDEALQADRMKIRVHTHWGYDGFDSGRWAAAARKNVDYLYAMTDHFGLGVNADVFMRAAVGTGGLPKHKPGGDQRMSWLERLDSVGNGAPSPSAWLRTVMEYEGPDGERIITGNPRTNIIDPETGNYLPLNSQEEFEMAMAEFNSKYSG